ncbi:MAG: DNA-directed RNA polymerase subunit A', partial [Candidatus Hermodarchaeota archaeon]|nr:DNA-directed RNA polymerase subunit A' [Candidatus Hermodarchaeota archaeon]
PQSEEARAEARILMLVQEQILSPRYGGPIIGGIQDYISSAFLLTRQGSYFNKRQTCQLLASAGYRQDLPPPEKKRPEPLWSGKQIFSLLLPKGLNLSLKAKVCQKCDECLKEKCPYDAFVLIRDGNLLTGVIDKKAIGAAQPESVLHRIAKDYGNAEARRFLDGICPLLVVLITNMGFSMGIDDVILSPTAIRQIEQILNDAEDEGNQLVQIYEADELQRLPGRSLEETFEMKMIEILARARDKAGEVASQQLGLDKHAVIMTGTGAKGNPLNLAQMAASVGQQAVRGQRISRGYRMRTLPHFVKGDLSPQARGFVVSSYRKGLNPIEFFFHAMGGREGLVDTAVRTSTSGYMQRRLINALQDIKVEYDGTVRNSNGEIIQFKYGEDGVDPARSDHGKAVNLDVVIERVLSKKG